MPIYEYRCSACGHQIELIQKMGERPRRKCPECGGRLEKLISRTSFLLKGGGWYSEGYSRGGESKGEAKSDKTDKGKNKKKAKSGNGSGSSDGSGTPPPTSSKAASS